MTARRATADPVRDRLAERIAAFIDALADGGRDDARRDTLLAELHAWQRAHVEPVGRIAAAVASPAYGLGAVPTDVFRFARVAAHLPAEDLRVFRTSGTTDATRGVHAFRDLALYDRAARVAGCHALFPDVERMRLLVLAPDEHEAPDSSLSYMLARFVEWFGESGSTYAWRDGALDVATLVDALVRAERAGEPVALLGTSFAFIHAADALGTRRFALPARSRVMHTGGLKGRAREVSPSAQLDALVARYGVPPAWIVQEYGMTELSSQLYETTLRDAVLGAPVRARVFWTPGWVRTSIVDPETLLGVAPGVEGLLRVDDLANVDGACAIQTSDRAVARDGGIVVLGRAPGATPRGCSIAVDAVLGAGRDAARGFDGPAR